jgi:hypothetical protein
LSIRPAAELELRSPGEYWNGVHTQLSVALGELLGRIRSSRMSETNRMKASNTCCPPLPQHLLHPINQLAPVVDIEFVE